MGRSFKGVNTSLNLSTKSPNKNQKASTAIAYFTNQDLRNFLKDINNSPYLGYKKKQVCNKLTVYYFFLIKQFYNIIKSKKCFWICN